MEAPVRIRFPGVDESYEGTIGNIGMAGLFIAGGAPMPAGTLMHFEFRPSPQWHELRGRGRIVWARQEPNAEGEPPGMGVRFIELDERGRRGVRWLIETYQAVGDKPFETWSVPSQFTRRVPSEGDVLTTQEIVPVPPTTTKKLAWAAKPWPLLAAGLIAVVLISGWALLGGDEDSGTEAAPQVADVGTSRPESSSQIGASSSSAMSTATSDDSTDGTSGAAAASAASADPGTALDPAPTAAEPPSALPATSPPVAAPSTAAASSAPLAQPASTSGSPTVEAVLIDLVGEWAAAWSSQNVDRYLAFYAPGFKPDSGQSRAAWARQRGDRLAGPEFIRVGVEAVQVLDQGSAMPRTVFTQSYESSTFGDQVTKSLTWTRSQGSWRILAERSAP